MKVLNLYAGIGGNRKLWEDVEVTAIENNKEIAKIYQDLFPDDQVIVTDAHQYLLDHYKEFDFIWSSPPCPTHSKIRNEAGVGCGQNEAVYPDMRLYQEIILLQKQFKGKWIVENVEPYYTPLILGKVVGRHLTWSNFDITPLKVECDDINLGTMDRYRKKADLSKYRLDNERQVLRNMVNPKLGLHIFNCAFKEKQETLKR